MCTPQKKKRNHVLRLRRLRHNDRARYLPRVFVAFRLVALASTRPAALAAVHPGGSVPAPAARSAAMGKEKKEKKDKTPSKSKEDSDGGDGELRAVCAIAKPLADVGFHKKILKVVKKGTTREVTSRLPARIRSP